jgi:hypothetical protein
MEVEEYMPNSHRSKDESKKESTPPDKKVEKIVSGTVKSRKKNEISNLADAFAPKDVSGVKTYILMDVLVPAIKKAVSDVVTNGIDMLLYGESENKKRGSTASKISYRSYYDKPRDYDRSDSDRRRARGGYEYDDIIFDNRGDAESVLEKMVDLIDHYGVVSISDLYDMTGNPGNYTDNKYGWMDISSASTVRIREGYIIKLPKALPLD